MQQIRFYSLQQLWRVLLLLCFFTPSLMAQSNFAFKDSLGTQESGKGELSNPLAFEIDADGNIFFIDSFSDKVVKLDKNGNYVLEFGSGGAGNGQLSSASGIALDSQGNIFVADRGNTRVQKFNSSGTYVSQFGTTGKGNGQFNYPTNIVIDKADNVYVVDARNDNVQKFDNNGVFKWKLGTTGKGNGQFDFPRYMDIDGDANLYVVDRVNDRVQKIDSSGAFVSVIGGPGTEDGKFSAPYGIGVDAQKTIYVFDNNYVMVFNADGSFKEKFKPQFPTQPNLFSFTDIGFDSNGSLYLLANQVGKAYRYATPKEINLKTDTTNIASGSTVDYGSVVVSQNSAKDFTLENLGGFDLTLSGTTGSQVVLGGTDASDFSVTQTNVTDKITGFSKVTFTVTFTPSGLGAKTATLTIASDDADEGTYTVNLTGTATSNVTGLPTNLVNGNIKVGPVPTADVLNLTIKGRASSNISYKIIDLQGRLNSQGAGVAKNGSLNLDVSQLRSGNYLLILKVGNETVVRRLQKN